MTSRRDLEVVAFATKQGDTGSLSLELDEPLSTFSGDSARRLKRLGKKCEEKAVKVDAPKVIAALEKLDRDHFASDTNERAWHTRSAVCDQLVSMVPELDCWTRTRVLSAMPSVGRLTTGLWKRIESRTAPSTNPHVCHRTRQSNEEVELRLRS